MNDKVWDYRVVRQTSEDGDEWLSVQEVYYDDDEKSMAHTIDLQIEGDSIANIRKQLQSMLWCLDKEIVDEIETPDVSFKLSDVEKYEGPEYLNKKYIYESPDGGNTIYRREFGKSERE
jgi:hypothetical protein